MARSEVPPFVVAFLSPVPFHGPCFCERPNPTTWEFELLRRTCGLWILYWSQNTLFSDDGPFHSNREAPGQYLDDQLAGGSRGRSKFAKSKVERGASAYKPCRPRVVTNTLAGERRPLRPRTATKTAGSEARHRQVKFPVHHSVNPPIATCAPPGQHGSALPA